MTPTGTGSGEADLITGADGRLYLSWVEPEGGDHVLKFARWEGDAWSSPRMIARGSDWFVNWADVPSMTVLEDGKTLFAHWLSKTGSGTYAYGVRVARSYDGGQSWSDPLIPHRDSTETEHGFVSWSPHSGDRAALVWLDGRETSGHEGHEGHGGPMTLRFATLSADGSLGDEALLDPRVCDCCPTHLVKAEDGTLFVVYRDRSDEEIRDISIARRDGNSWTEGRLVHSDGWKIAGCPVNGPRVAVEGSLVAVAWYTVDDADRGHVRIAFSHDRAATFEPPVLVSGPDPLGRVGLTLLPEGTAWVAWLESVKDGLAEVRLSSVNTKGERSDPIVVATTSGARVSGIPRLASLGEDLFVAWTDVQETEGKTLSTRVLTARVH